MSTPELALGKRPGGAPSKRRSTEIQRLGPMIGGFVLLAAIAAGSIWLFIVSHGFNASVAHTLQVRSDAYRLLTLVQDAETGQRGFLLTGDQAYLAPYKLGTAETPGAFRELARLTLGSTIQTATIARLRKAVDGKLGELALTVAMKAAGDSDGALARLKQNVGKAYMDDIRLEIGRIEAEEERFQSVQADAVETNNRLLAAASLAGVVVVIGLAVLTIGRMRRDVREVLQAQDELRHTNENLESIVAERVIELQTANEEIQRFAYIVSHDLRAPLVNVMGFTSELESVRGEIESFLRDVETAAPTLVTSDRRLAIETDLPEALGFIRTSTQKMDRLINAILKLSREGRRVLTPQRIDLGELVETQGQSLSQQLEAAQAKLEVQKNLPDLVSDRLAIEQIFGNLIENAVKYLDANRAGEITVTGREHGTYRRYDIADNGRGIEPKDFERIFELFRRSGEQDKPGEGIGLAYVRNLARRLGGNVTVQSDYGKGSTFTVTLPSVFSTRARVAR